jgi:hypothetical protein
MSMSVCCLVYVIVYIRMHTHTHTGVFYILIIIIIVQRNRRLASIMCVRTMYTIYALAAYDVRKYAMRVPRGFDLDAAIAHYPKRVHQPE